jgi:hypothetical protein
MAELSIPHLMTAPQLTLTHEPCMGGLPYMTKSTLTHAGVDFFPQSGTKNWVSAEQEPCENQKALLKHTHHRTPVVIGGARTVE